ncbi:MAG: M23 family metallopeptidase [Planctomycetota bacterium]
MSASRRSARPGRSGRPGDAAWEQVLSGPGRAGPEPWAWFAFLIAAATAVLFLYLGLRPGGTGPIDAYTVGRLVLFLLGAVTLLVGIGWSLFRRPVLQRARLGAFLSLGASVWFCAYPLAYPSSFEGHPSAVAFRLPFEGEWTVRWGGKKGPQNALVLYPDRRFGYDFVRCDDEGASGGAGGSLCLGEAVLAPAAGEVVAVHDGEPDRAAGAAAATGEPYGNHVVLRVADGEYLFLIGLQQNSLAVAVGDLVEPGQVLARVGFSARSPLTPEPHLGLHLQATPDLRRGEGIPLEFRGYASGGRTVARGVPRGGLAGGRHTGERVRIEKPR